MYAWLPSALLHNSVSSIPAAWRGREGRPRGACRDVEGPGSSLSRRQICPPRPWPPSLRSLLQDSSSLGPECWYVRTPKKPASTVLRWSSYYLSPLLERDGKATQPKAREFGKQWTSGPALGFCHQVRSGSFSWRNPRLLR